MTAIYRTPQVPHTKVFYWLCGYWTFDKSEADLIDDGLESSSLHGTAYFPSGAPPELIDAEIKLLVQNQRPARDGVITRAINRSF
ncbi:hypothetical protein HMY34_01950 [Thiothrix subterranea]|uniref:hypothetical protein n=1 Tax=Thiothrix subterranea TaxID=2735563 RepID=UPI00192B540D|nr:hypothetical protein [Thiothrix subterranea]QQZ27611.1 hypothetical protein HMY34_01950 [Thiothrix subterranea]